MKYSSLIVILFLLTSACTPATPAAPTPDFAGTIVALSGTTVALTLTAIPTATLEPSSTPTLVPTETPIPAASETPVPVIQASPTYFNQASATAWEGTLSPGNTGGLPDGALRLENNSGVKEVIFTFNCITTTRSQPVYYAWKVTGAFNTRILFATCQYVIQIPNKKIFTGTFKIANDDKTTIRVEPRKVIITGP